MPVFMDLQGGLKGAQIEKTAFMWLIIIYMLFFFFV
jgi:hypothetical protein